MYIPKQLQESVCSLRESSRGWPIVNGPILELNMGPFTIGQPRGFGTAKSRFLKLFRYKMRLTISQQKTDYSFMLRRNSMLLLLFLRRAIKSFIASRGERSANA